MKVHDLALRADYEIASKEHEYFFELDVSFSYTHPGSLFVLNFPELLFFPLHSYKSLFIAIMDIQALRSLALRYIGNKKSSEDCIIY